MITMQVIPYGQAELRRAFEQAPDVAVDELRLAIESLVIDLAGLAATRWPKVTRNSAQSILPSVSVTPLGVLGLVGSPKSEVTFVELGTKPHWAPIRPLQEWVEKKFGISGGHAWAVAKVIQRNIAARGTQGKRIFEQVLQANQSVIQLTLDAAVARIVVRLQGGPGAPA